MRKMTLSYNPFFFISAKLSLNMRLGIYKVKLDIIKHSSSFTYSDFTLDFTSLSALHHIAAEQLHFLLVERWFRRKQVRRQGSALRHIVPCVPLQRFLGLNSKPCLAIAKDTVGYNRCF